MSSDPLDANAITTRDLQRTLSSLQDQHQRLYAQLQAGQRRFQSIARSVWRVQEDERRRLARELHDGIGQNLTALKNQLGSMVQGAEETDSTLVDDLRAALNLCAECLADTRELSRLLRPQILDDLGLVPALKVLARTSGERAGITVEVIERGIPPDLDVDLATLVYRLAQEAVTNAVKHAGGDHVLIKLLTRGGQIRLLVLDNGAGFDVEAALSSSEHEQAFGLHGMRERVALFGGRFDVNSTPGEGTSVRASLPLGADAGSL